MIKLMERKEIFNNGFVEMYDFSEANANQQNREEACALVGGACRNVIIKHPESFFKRLRTEHDGKPSEVFQFIPVIEQYEDDQIDAIGVNNYWRFGYLSNNNFFETNLRNIVNYDIGCEWKNPEDALEQKIFNKRVANFVVFKIKIPGMVCDHLRRHKYLSEEFSENWQSNRSKHYNDYFENDEVKINTVGDYIGENIEYHYYPELINGSKRVELINKGDFGLRYVTGWIGAYTDDPAAWKNFFSVRLKNPSQKETKMMANVMYDMICEHYDYNK